MVLLQCIPPSSIVVSQVYIVCTAPFQMNSTKRNELKMDLTTCSKIY